MAAFMKRQFFKNDIGYQFVDTRDFGPGLHQSDIETRFASACSTWSPHCGLNFTKVEANPDLVVKWAKLAKQEWAGETTISGSPVTITFNTDRAWTASKLDPNYADFLSVAMHELGHAIGLAHSDADQAVMQDTHSTIDFGRLLFNELAIDDAVGARVLYGLPCPQLNPNNSLHDQIIVLVNQTADPVQFWFYINGDGAMAISLPGPGSINPWQATYWKETQLIWNISRRYRVKVNNSRGEVIRDDIEPSQIIYIGTAPGLKPSLHLAQGGPEGISG
nr:matrixin family metalloprotease [uncultured Rhodopila sp.]